MNDAWLCVSRCAVHLPAAVVGAYIALHGEPACNERCSAVVIPPAAWAPGGDFAPGGALYGLPIAPVAAPAPDTEGLTDVGPVSYATGPVLLRVPPGVPGSTQLPSPVVVGGRDTPPTPVPEPASWMMFAAFVLGLFGIHRRSRSDKTRRA